MISKIEDYKNYVIVTNRVSDIGGAQLYTLRRAKYLIEKGVNVKIIVKENSNFLLKDLFEAVNVLVLDTLNRDFLLVSENEKKDTLDILKSESIFWGNTIIESHTPDLAIWSEFFASHFLSKSIIYFLSEFNLSSKFYSTYYDYFQWKFKRREIYAISNVSLEMIFGLKMYPNLYVNVPFNEKEVSEKTNPKLDIDIPNGSFVISTVSRLEKSYVKKLIQEVIRLSKKLSQSRFILIIAGDDKNSHLLSDLKNSAQNDCTNLSIHFLGYINPIGKDFFRISDIFIGMGTAAVSAISQKCATITIDPLSSKASGVFGLTTSNFAYSETGNMYELIDLIENFVGDRHLLENAGIKGYELYQKEFEVGVCMNKLDEYIIKSEKGKNYYDFSGLSVFLNKIKLYFLNYLLRIYKIVK